MDIEVKLFLIAGIAPQCSFSILVVGMQSYKWEGLLHEWLMDACSESQPDGNPSRIFLTLTGQEAVKISKIVSSIGSVDTPSQE